MRRLRRQELILKKYEKQLEDRERKGEIGTNIKETYLTNAHRILEALIKCTPMEMIRGALKETGFRRTDVYIPVINALKKITERREG